jgi:hypothetical protein
MKRMSILNFNYYDFHVNLIRQYEGNYSIIVTLFGRTTQFNDVSLEDAYAHIEDMI